VTEEAKCGPAGVELFLVAPTGSDLLALVVLVAELVELAIRKPVTTTTTTTRSEQTYVIRYLVVKIKGIIYIYVNIKQTRFPAYIMFYPTVYI
jgi:hypothetical protein